MDPISVPETMPMPMSIQMSSGLGDAGDLPSPTDESVGCA